MCTLAILRRPEHDWPVIIGANRDEMIDRPAAPPGRHWPDRLEVVAGRDLLAGGSWLGLNDWGVAAARALGDLDPVAYRSFNLIVADNRDAFWLRHAETGRIEVRPVKDGLSLIAAGEIDDLRTPRLALAKPRFRAAAPPDPDHDDWTAWQDILGDDTVPASAPPGVPPEAALRFRTDRGYGTESSALIALPAVATPERRPIFRFAGWQPEETPWRNVGGG